MNFDRSLEFYKTLGFKVVLNIDEGANPANDKGLGIPNSVGRVQLKVKGASAGGNRREARWGKVC